jgi:hypothetical protein
MSGGNECSFNWRNKVYMYFQPYAWAETLKKQLNFLLVMSDVYGSIKSGAYSGLRDESMRRKQI